jgi:hypothetical protein
MTSLAVESAVNEYASTWLQSNFRKDRGESMEFLEKSMDFRRTVELLEFVGVLGKELGDELQDIYTRRNHYSHILSSKILGKTARETDIHEMTAEGTLLRKLKIKNSDVATMLVIYREAQENARELLRKTELSLAQLFAVRISS